MFASAWDEDLDEAQLAAVTHGDDPLVVLAGAGTGKTRTLTCRVARLLEAGVAPERILLLTFTRRAADDMLAQAAALAGHSDLARRLCGGTFHAVAHQFLTAWGEHLGLGEGFSLLDPGDAADVMELVRDEHGWSELEERGPRASTLVDLYSRCVNTGRPLAEVVAADFPWCERHLAPIASVFRAYVARKRQRGQIDFDDLLIYWRAALLDEQLGPHLAGLFDHVLVDEYQDVNPVQVDIVAALRPGGRGLTVVGDDAQAIYGFRGADAAHLGDLIAALPSARVVLLERNYRSLQPILDVANHVRPPLPGRDIPRDPQPAGERLVLTAARTGGARPRLVRCHDAPSEARAVVDAILERHQRGRRLAEQAVLVRASHHCDLIELELAARHVPYRKFGGLRFIEAAHVKDFVAAVRLLDNTAHDIAWFRLLRLHEGIGPSRARALLETLPPQRRAGDWTATAAAAPPAARVALLKTLRDLDSARAEQVLSARVELVVELLRPLVTTRYASAAARLRDLERLAGAAVASGDLATWLAGVVLDPPLSTAERAGPPHLDEDYVVVSTVHSAKGLEWSIVHLPHLVDGAFPSDMALRSPHGLDEERRLFYVAVTRARDELVLYTPLRMPHRRRGADDRHSFAQHSRFLDDGVSGLLQLEEQRPERRPLAGQLAGLGAVEPAARRAAVAAAVDLDRLWG